MVGAHAEPTDHGEMAVFSSPSVVGWWSLLTSRITPSSVQFTKSVELNAWK
jgi:hypothetical protein